MTQLIGATQQARIIVRLDPDIEDIVPIFFEKLNEEIEMALKSLERDDFEDIQIWGHILKGAGSGYGFDRVSEIGECLEQSAKSQNADRTRKLVEELSNYLEQVEVVYEP